MIMIRILTFVETAKFSTFTSISPSTFVNSPIMAEKYLVYLEVLRSGEEVLGEIYETDVFEWVVKPFEQLLHLFPDFFAFDLDIIDEKVMSTSHLQQRISLSPVFCRFGESFLDELEE
ncbi:hypothetical protein ED733_005552 [Metarhizium rileyi]|uniref:Uncharacterized protein n=1 Tax=Metarhizium rileyi (strain RCEF 4871) TaxID=1649241 RepID=A0A5C6GG49_METRR|nr:hypothetical protein ED733_005552 [Metarhizium rileyi]